MENIGPTWQKLVEWLAHSKYGHAGHQWLEEHIGPAVEDGEPAELIMDLYAPIAEQA